MGIVVLIGLKKRNWNVGKRMCQVVVVTALLGCLAGIAEEQNTIWDQDGNLIRRPNGEGDYEVELVVDIEGVVSDYACEITVPEQKLTKEEEEAYLDAAIEEIEQSFPGSNESLEAIYNRAVIAEVYQNGKVQAEWFFDNYDVIDTSGNVLSQQLSQDGELVRADVELTCEDSYRNYSFFFRVLPEELDLSEKIVNKLNEELINNGNLEGKSALEIPDTVENYKLYWQENKDQMPEKMLFLGILAAGLIPVLEKSRKQEEQKKRELLLQMEYPDMVSKLTLLLGAGMTLLTAWRRIATDYSDKRKKNTCEKMPVYEEMVITCREIESGIGEAKAYIRFGERCGLRRYRKFSSLIVQNLKKGSMGLNNLLSAEAEDAFEERKSLAKKLGEEAGTKLLLPMMLMLGLVIMVIMIPAIMSFGLG